MRNILKIIGVGAIGLYLLSKAYNTFVSNISIDSASIKFGSISLSGVPILITLGVLNNTNIPIPLQNFKGNLLYGNEPIAPLLIKAPITIEANKITYIKIDTNINFRELANDILQVITTKQYLNNLSLEGQLSYENYTIPIHTGIKIIG